MELGVPLAVAIYVLPCLWLREGKLIWHNSDDWAYQLSRLIPMIMQVTDHISDAAGGHQMATVLGKAPRCYIPISGSI